MNNKLIFVCFVFAVGVRFFSFTLIDDIYFDLLEVVIVAMLIFYNITVNKTLKTPFTFYIKLIIVISLLSSIPAYLFHNQSFGYSLLTSRIIFFWLLYFTLHKMNINPKKLEELLVIFGVLWSSIMIIQQFTYPHILFDVYHGVTYEDGVAKNVDIRGGIIRVWIAGVGFSYFLASYMWQKLYENLSFKNIFLFLIVIAGILLMQSRQVIFGLMLIFIADVVLSFRVSDFKTIRFTTIFIGLAVIFFAVAGDFIFALIELSKEQNVTSGDYVRGLEIDFFLFKYWPDPLCYIIGNGWEHDSSPYGVEIKEQIKWGMGLYRSDIGIIGAFNKFGIIYVIVTVIFYMKILIPRKNFIIPKYIKIFFVLCVLTSFTGSNFFENPSYFLPFVCLFYIIDKTNEQYLHRNSNLQQAVTDAKRYPVAV